MTRKKLVTALSIIYICNGLWDIGIFLYLGSLPSEAVLDITSIVSGILALYIGLQLLQFHEIGRKFAIFFSYLQVVMNVLFSFWSLYLIQTAKEKIVVAALTFRDKQIYSLGNPYIIPGFWLASIIIPLLIIVFLSQSKTGKLFTPPISRDTSTEGISSTLQD